MRRIIAIAYTIFAVLAFVLGYFASTGPDSGPLNYIFVIVAGFPWTVLLTWMFPSVSSPALPALGVLINLALVWWWASRRRTTV